MWNWGLRKSRVHAASLESVGQPFYGWTVDEPMMGLKPVSNGLLFQVSAAKANDSLEEADWA